MSWAFWTSLTDQIGLDLGTARVRIWGKQAGLVVDEQMALALDTQSQKVLAVGQDAMEMKGRVSQPVEVRLPVARYGVTDSDSCLALLQAMMQPIFRFGFFFRPVMMAAVHSHWGAAERQQLVELLLRLGAREVYLVDEILAAAIGAGVPVADASGGLFLHIGAHTTEVGVISLGSVVQVRTSQVAGQQVTQQLQQFLKEHAGLVVGSQRAEALKCQLLGAGSRVSRQVRVAGQSLEDKQPSEVFVDVSELVTIVEPIITEYVALTTKFLAQVPPELAQDVLDKGMLLSGGGAQLVGLAPQLSQQLGFPVSVVDEPATAVIRGVSQVLQNLDSFRQSIGYRQPSEGQV